MKKTKKQSGWHKPENRLIIAPKLTEAQLLKNEQFRQVEKLSRKR